MVFLNLSHAYQGVDQMLYQPQGGELGTFSVFIFILTIIAAILAAILYIGTYRMYEKMGEQGWKMFLPMYSRYVLYQHVWNPKAYIAMVVLVIACGMSLYAAVFVTTLATMMMPPAAVPLPDYTLHVAIGSSVAIVAFVIHVIFSYKLSQSFGRGIGTTLGLAILPGIFCAVLGFGSAQFTQPDTAVWADVAVRRNNQVKKDIENVQIGLSSRHLTA